ncbi:MAG TPA: DNA-directed RNA polymerase subunit omega [Vicinamibacterales bacterium]|nr:DNA-directed RNA polymerase subunit omega [Vicinamibacterales bacterium]
MSEVEIEEGEATAEEPQVPREPAQPIESRFLFVDVAALRAKQLRRGAKPRLSDDPDADHGPRPIKAERTAMSEVRNGLVEWQLPDFKAVFDTR